MLEILASEDVRDLKENMVKEVDLELKVIGETKV